MRGLIDLHCHYLPAVDDGVRTLEEGVALCRGLASLGYATVAATPHIRSAMFENQRPDLEQRFAAFVAATERADGLPALLLGAEHFCDDSFRSLFEHSAALPFAGGKAALIELPPEQIPLGFEDQVFRMQVRSVRPLLAHPERYPTLFASSEPIERAVELGALPQLDLMSLVGKYGRRPQRTAERMLEEELYFVASTDCHRAEDVEHVERALQRLVKLVGEEGAELLLRDNPGALLRGEVEA